MAMIQVSVGNNLNRTTVTVDGATTTLRQVFDMQEINYSIGVPNLDGSTLKPGDLDKTFAEMGVTGERCYLTTIVKADNAAAAKITGAACVITSTAKLEDLQLLAKYRPEALSLYEGEGNAKKEIFKVLCGKGEGSINSIGAVFGEATAQGGKATITMMIPSGVADAKKWAEEHIGTAILKLKKVEDALAPHIEAVKTEQKAVADAITAE